MPDTPSLRVAHLSCRRGGRVLFTGLGLLLEAGGALVLTGPNGAGKTSLLRILAGLLQQGAGEVTLLPADGERTLPQRSRFVGTRDALKAGLTPSETLRHQAAILDGDPARLEKAIAAFGLLSLADMPNGWLSTGQRRRVALSSLLLTGMARPLWLLDEPANGLDRQALHQLGAAIAAHRHDGGMVIAASHQSLDWPGVRELPLGTPA